MSEWGAARESRAPPPGHRLLSCRQATLICLTFLGGFRGSGPTLPPALVAVIGALGRRRAHPPHPKCSRDMFGGGSLRLQLQHRSYEAIITKRWGFCVTSIVYQLLRLDDNENYNGDYHFQNYLNKLVYFALYRRGHLMYCSFFVSFTNSPAFFARPKSHF